MLTVLVEREVLRRQLAPAGEYIVPEQQIAGVLDVNRHFASLSERGSDRVAAITTSFQANKYIGNLVPFALFCQQTLLMNPNLIFKGDSSWKSMAGRYCWQG